MKRSAATRGLAAVFLALIALPLTAQSQSACGTAYSSLQSDFTKAAAQLAPTLCKNPGRFQVLAQNLVETTNAKIANFNRTRPPGSCDPDVPTPVPPKNTAHVMMVLQDNIGAIPLDRYCNNLLDGNLQCGNSREDAGEACDGTDLNGQTCETLGQGAGTLSCAADCQSFQLGNCSGPAYCGNGQLDAGEACDDGNGANSDNCTSSCTVSQCGDGILMNGTEECDDGNQVNGDACTNICKYATCGDGIVYGVYEQCDDGNDSNGDGCSVSCRLEEP